jgi:hypothetical protein
MRDSLISECSLLNLIFVLALFHFLFPRRAQYWATPRHPTAHRKVALSRKNERIPWLHVWADLRLQHRWLVSFPRRSL